MTRVTRLLVIVASSNCCRPNFSSIVATGSRPPYGVRFLPSKSYGVEAPILLGSGCVAWIACLAALFRLCFFPRLTIWVTSLGFCAAELLPPHPRFYSMFSGVTNWSTSAQPSRIRSRVHNSGLMIVGDVSLERIARVFQGIETQLGRQVNPTVYTVPDFKQKLTEESHFLRTVLGSPVLFVQGTRNDLEGLTEKPACEAASDESRRAARSPRGGGPRSQRRKA